MTLMLDWLPALPPAPTLERGGGAARGRKRVRGVEHWHRPGALLQPQAVGAHIPWPTTATATKPTTAHPAAAAPGLTAW
jgi:hypothetical protein